MEDVRGDGMSWILAMQIKEEPEHWEWVYREYRNKEIAEAAGIAAKIDGLCSYYEIYHS